MEEHKVAKTVTKKCPYCGEHLPPLTKVCPSCGQIVEDADGETDVASMMTEIDKICGSYSGLSIRFYDYILLLVPAVYLVWALVVITKIIRSNKKYNKFLVYKSKAQTLYGENSRFRTYLGNKITEVEEVKRKNRVSHAIIYVLLLLDVVLLGFSFMSI